MILLDECVQRIIGVRLAEAGFQVHWMRELGVGTHDPEVLQLATQQRWLLLTRDKDFGDLIFRDRLPAYGVLLYRLPTLSLHDATARVVSWLVDHHHTVPGHLVLLEQETCRSRVLPG